MIINQTDECLKHLKIDYLSNNESNIKIVHNDDNNLLIKTLDNNIEIIKKRFIPLLNKFIKLLLDYENQTQQQPILIRNLNDNLFKLNKVLFYKFYIIQFFDVYSNLTFISNLPNSDFVNVEECDEHELLFGDDFFNSENTRKRKLNQFMLCVILNHVFMCLYF